MRADTRSVTISADVATVVAFLADPGNLPRWAVGFAHAVRREEDRWIVVTGQGDVPISIDADMSRGTIDFHMRPAPGIEAVAYSRVLPNATGSEYVFTQFQTPGMSDDVFAAQVATLREELAILPAIFRARATCPAGAHERE